MTSTTTAVQANIARLAGEQGLTLEELAEKAHEPLTALTGERLYLRAVERVARTLDVPVNEVFGFGSCEPWCNDHRDDGETDYGSRRVGQWQDDYPVEIWHDQAGTCVNFDEPVKADGYTVEHVRALHAALAEALRVLDAIELASS